MLSSDRLPSLASIGAFEAAARHGSFAAAARELGTSAASVSYHVRQLELQTGVTLFRRSARSVDLTDAGRAIAEQAIEAFAALRSSFIRIGDAERLRLAITTLPTLGASWMAPRLGGFCATHPSVEVDLDLSPEARDLRSGQFDAAIRIGHGRWRGLRSTYLFPSLFTPLCAPGLLDAAAVLTDPDRSYAPPLLGRPDWWSNWFRTLGDDRPRKYGVRFADEHLDAAAAIAGHGITIGSPLLFRKDLEAGRLVPAHPMVVDTGLAFWLVHPVGRAHLDKLRLFARWVEDEAAAERVASRAFIERARPAL
jgi:LysR family glycine cleavage system transcriptional activator